MELPTRKLVHTFGALADLGQEITDSSNFGEMVLTSLRLLLGALGIRRGAVAEYSRAQEALNFVAVRGLPAEFPSTLVVTDQARTALLAVGMAAVEFSKLSGLKIAKSFHRATFPPISRHLTDLKNTKDQCH